MTENSNAPGWALVLVGVCFGAASLWALRTDVLNNLVWGLFCQVLKSGSTAFLFLFFAARVTCVWPAADRSPRGRRRLATHMLTLRTS